MASVNKRPDTGKWQVRYRGPDGKQRSQDFRRMVDATRFAAEVETDKARGEWLNPEGAARELELWADWWLSQSHRQTLRPSTYAGQWAVYRSLIRPVFGGCKLGEITQPAVQAWVNDLGARLAPATVRKAYQILSKIMGAAVDADYLPKSPCRRINLPADDRQQTRFLTPAEVGELADAIDPRYRALVLLGAYGGLRIGEMSGLRRSRVQLPRGVVEVDQVLAEVGGKLYFQEPKTKASRRRVPLPRPVAEELGQHMGPNSAPGPDGLVFTAPEGGPLRLPTWRRRFWAPAVEAAGLAPLRVHDLRHTAVSLWIATGTNVKAVSVRAGHTSVSFTLDRYGHLFEDSDDVLTGRLEGMYVPSARTDVH